MRSMSTLMLSASIIAGVACGVMPEAFRQYQGEREHGGVDGRRTMSQWQVALLTCKAGLSGRVLRPAESKTSDECTGIWVGYWSAC